MDVVKLHQKMIYPIVRVRTQRAGGSGIVVFSKPAGPDGEMLTYVLTNHHVISDAIGFEEKWDGLSGRDVKTEVRSPVEVEIFSYRNLSWEEGTKTVQADIVAWDEPFDLALLQLRSEAQYKYVADLYPRDLVKELRIGEQTLTVGCSLGHKPIPSSVGMITSLDESMENQRWWMHSSPAIYGNSGGACFVMNRFEVFGITSRIAVSMAGFSMDPITWLVYVIPVTRIYGWLEDVHYDFIFNVDKSYEECELAREEAADLLRSAWENRFRRERDIAQGGSGVSRSEMA